MPRSSKKNRGRQRKANREAKKQQQPQAAAAAATAAAATKEEEEERTLASMFSWSFDDRPRTLKKLIDGCDHGCPEPPPGHVVFDAFNCYLGALDEHKGDISQAFDDLLISFPQVHLDDETMSMLKAKTLSLGTGILLLDLGKEECDGFFSNLLSGLVVYIECFEDFKQFGKMVIPRNIQKQIRDLSGDGKRSSIPFYAKRIPCDCLKDICKETKQQTKMGKCANCQVQMEFRALKPCRRCLTQHYCCHECHVSNWPRHKKFCQKIQKPKDDDDDENVEVID